MKNAFYSGIFILICAGMVSAQMFYDSAKAKAVYTEPVVFKSDVIKVADLGLHNAASDLFWLAAIQYLGGGDSATYEKLDDYLFLSADLDPQFAYPYAFGALLLPAFKQMDRGIEIAHKGVDNNVADWRISYYLATILYLNKDNLPEAAKYFDLAANTPGAPDGIKKVAANFGTNKDKRDQTIKIWQGIYETTNDEVVKERAKNYIIHLEILNLLDQASEEYNKRNGKYPADINDLVAGRILTAIPPDPFGFEFSIDQSGKAQAK